MKKFWEGKDGAFRYSDVVYLKVVPKVRTFYKSWWDALFTHKQEEEEIIGYMVVVRLRGGHSVNIQTKDLVEAKSVFYHLLELVEVE
jgi:hypothetical protein